MKLKTIYEARYHAAPRIPIVVTVATNYNGVSGSPDTEKMEVSYEELEDQFPDFDRWVADVLEVDFGDLAEYTDGPEQELMNAAKEMVKNDGRFGVSSIRIEYDNSST